MFGTHERDKAGILETEQDIQRYIQETKPYTPNYEPSYLYPKTREEALNLLKEFAKPYGVAVRTGDCSNQFFIQKQSQEKEIWMFWPTYKSYRPDWKRVKAEVENFASLLNGGE